MDTSSPGLPMVRDFSQKAISKVVLSESLTHPATIYPGVASVLGMLTWTLFGFGAALQVAVAGVFIGVGSCIVNYFFRDQAISHRYIQRISNQLAQRQLQLRENLERKLAKCQEYDCNGAYAKTGSEQFRLATEKYENIRSLLEQKLNVGELTFGRFLGATEQVYLAVLDNLKSITAILESSSTINPEYIGKRLAECSQDGSNPETQRESDSLRRRQELHEQQLRSVKRLIALNEDALTRMEEVSAEIADMRTGGDFAELDPETSIVQLQELARTIHLYDNNLIP